MDGLGNILVCPETGNRVFVDWGNSAVRIEGTDRVYPIEEGIIDFLPGIFDIHSTGNMKSIFYFDMDKE